MSTSPQRLAANRANARRSTGPRTVEGKAVSSRNSRRHGLLSRVPLLPDEDGAEFEALLSRLLEHLDPSPGHEELLVDDIAALVWRLRRLGRVEAALFAMGASGAVGRALVQAGETANAPAVAFAAEATTFGLLSRYETTLVNRLRRALLDLDVLQRARREATIDERPGRPQPLVVGFVSQPEASGEEPVEALG
jgi:hypothetical protein